MDFLAQADVAVATKGSGHHSWESGMGTRHGQVVLRELGEKCAGSGRGLNAGRGINVSLRAPSPGSPSEAKPGLKWWGRGQKPSMAPTAWAAGASTAGCTSARSLLPPFLTSRAPSMPPPRPDAKLSESRREGGPTTFRSPNRLWSRVSKP